MIKPPKTDSEAYALCVKATAAIRAAKYWMEVCKEHARKGGTIAGDGYEWKEGDRGFRWTKIKS